jgi:hypothetical protein
VAGGWSKISLVGMRLISLIVSELNQINIFFTSRQLTNKHFHEENKILDYYLQV